MTNSAATKGQRVANIYGMTGTVVRTDTAGRVRVAWDVQVAKLANTSWVAAGFWHAI